MCKQLLFFIPNFNGGGAERALITLLSRWVPERHGDWSPSIVVRQNVGNLRDQVPNWVKVTSLELPRSGFYSSIATTIKLTFLFRRLHPSVVISFLSLPSVVLAKQVARSTCRLVASIQTPLLASGVSPNRFMNWVIRQTDYVWAISPGIANEILTVFHVNKTRIQVLPNPVDLDLVNKKKNSAVDHAVFSESSIPVVITACRLTREKRIDVLLDAVSFLKSTTSINLVILGEGELRTELEDRAKTLGIHQQVFFLGFQSNPWKYISKSAVFALASDYEGFGNVLVEAMACGVPVIATRAPFGPEYIITDNVSGLLVRRQDPDAMANGILRLLSDNALRQRCITNGLQRAKDFHVETIVQSFERLLQSVELQG
ncbi:N-acetylgalactosamine-N, N'-diacetylbacillosaminyl-diphospho-undecaprenol 4-alpha-N-acetylgalactosaminyltransferase [Candidatus Brocadiaceae bacterium]|nr:N-acetylgalactosamine-N, N'-diacetylbacillosaminyl-diphospho-undecaprenol 4-alpha-N-acetylgalactosaminyltransferase [Candidatus Brocadiaceae bacterium]